MRKNQHGCRSGARVSLVLALLLSLALLLFSGCANRGQQEQNGEDPSLQQSDTQGQKEQGEPAEAQQPDTQGQKEQGEPAEAQQPDTQGQKEQGEPAEAQQPDTQGQKEQGEPAGAQQPDPAQPAPSAPSEPAQSLPSCTLVVECSTVLSHMEELDPDKEELIPQDGILLQTEVVLEEGDTAYDVLERAAREANLHLESSVTPGYNSVYIEGIGNLYEFDCGSLSGWIYFVNGESFSHSASQQAVQAGDEVAFRYTCDMGEDLK